jgi:hypothetical protein
MVFGFPAVQGLELFLGENVLHVEIVVSTFLRKLLVVSQVQRLAANQRYDRPP